MQTWEQILAEPLDGYALHALYEKLEPVDTEYEAMFKWDPTPNEW